MDCLVPVLGWVHPTAEAAAQCTTVMISMFILALDGEEQSTALHGKSDLALYS